MLILNHLYVVLAICTVFLLNTRDMKNWRFRPISFFNVITRTKRRSTLAVRNVRLSNLLTIQLTSGTGIFGYMYRRMQTSSNYCDNIQPYDKIRFSFCQMWHDFSIVFFANYHKFELLTFARQCGNVLKVWWEILCGFCWKFSSLSSSQKNFENSSRIDKVIAMSLVYYFLGHSVIIYMCTVVSWIIAKLTLNEITENAKDAGVLRRFAIL